MLKVNNNGLVFLFLEDKYLYDEEFYFDCIYVNAIIEVKNSI